ncbi:hypothetical protein EVAR_102352_1 [Eumeta japonica]|uniref:Uncharacterized protein n=1 Tax=Eumeta variegata TaxID=151549 RepID=A0A4C1XLM1_EUMVA|nr:hypothetical protein EVAR_102352_1 [Eumeta japonica]
MLVRVLNLVWLLATAFAAPTSAEESNSDQSPFIQQNVQTAESSYGPPMDFVHRNPHTDHERPTFQKEDGHRLIPDIYRPDYIKPEYALDYRVAGLKGRPLKTLPWGPVAVLPQQVPRIRLAVPPGFGKPKQEHVADAEEKNLRGWNEHSRDHHHETLFPVVPVVQRIVIPHNIESNHGDRGHAGRHHHHQNHHIQNYREDHRDAHSYSDHRDHDHIHYDYAPEMIFGKDFNRATFPSLKNMLGIHQHH